MDRNALPAGDEADDVVAGNRGAAAGELDQTVVQTFDQNAVNGLGVPFCLLLAPFGGVGHLFYRAAVIGFAALCCLVAQTVGDPDRGDAAVADGRIEVVLFVERQLLHHRMQDVRIQRIFKRDAHMAQLVLQHRAAAQDVLFPPFLLVPLLDLGACRAALYKAQPVAAGPGRGFGSADFDNVAVLQHRVIGDDPAVDLCADHVVADVRVNAVGKVDRRGARRQIDDVPLRREYEHLVGEHVDFQVVDKVRGVRFRLGLEQTPDPGKFVLVSAAHGAAAVTHFVFPVGGDAVFGGIVHLPGPDLHLEGDALGTDDRRMDTLIHVRLRRRDIVFKAAGNRLVHIVNDAQHVVAVRDRVDNHAEGAEIENAVDVQLLGVHFPIDAVDMLDAAEDGGVDALLFEAGADLLFHALHEGFQLGHPAVQRIHDLAVALRVQVPQREILKLPLGPLHAQSVGDGRIDFHGLQRLGPLLFGRLIVHGAHVVQAVGDFDENDADVLGHGHQHLAQILHLLVFLAGILYAGQLGDPFHNIRNLSAELAGNILVLQIRVFDHIMQKRGNDAVFIQPDIRRDVRGRDAVRDVRAAVLAFLPRVRGLGNVIGGTDAPDVHGMALLAELFFQSGKHGIRIQGSIRLWLYGSFPDRGRLIGHGFFLRLKASSKSSYVTVCFLFSERPQLIWSGVFSFPCRARDRLPGSAELKLPQNLHNLRGVEVGFGFRPDIAAAVHAPVRAGQKPGL